MKFRGIEYAETMEDKYKYTVPKLKPGNVVKLLYDDEIRPLPGSRRMKRGNYVVMEVDNSMFSRHGKVYVLLKNGAKHDYRINSIVIDKAIEGNAIIITKCC